MGALIQGIMGMDKSSSSTTKKTPEPAPTVAHENVQASADATRRRERAAAGRASTQLTGGAGVTSDSTSIGTKKLLGQ